ncbi:MAG TPA: hypothetical protein DHV12_06800 [Thermotogae bacterium]|nr:hypothetical protein [Thermotogota bacterium]
MQKLIRSYISHPLVFFLKSVKQHTRRFKLLFQLCFAPQSYAFRIVLNGLLGAYEVVRKIEMI